MARRLARSLTHGFHLVVLACVLAGCGRPPASRPPASPTQPAAKDQRTRWTYDTGWFVQGNGTAWFEHNAEATRIHGGPWEFTETKRTPEYVELHDARRDVSVRLSAQDSEARWDKDGANAAWRPLYKGRWEKRE
ncbi:MAG: hypothetical protein JNM56_21740 [Planctomycetia bacterium]|nr:hypothetical protein [Planctomycetia bacterium]